MSPWTYLRRALSFGCTYHYSEGAGPVWRSIEATPDRVANCDPTGGRRLSTSFHRVSFRAIPSHPSRTGIGEDARFQLVSVFYEQEAYVYLVCPTESGSELCGRFPDRLITQQANYAAVGCTVQITMLSFFVHPTYSKPYTYSSWYESPRTDFAIHTLKVSGQVCR